MLTTNAAPATTITQVYKDDGDNNDDNFEKRRRRQRQQWVRTNDDTTTTTTTMTTMSTKQRRRRRRRRQWPRRKRATPNKKVQKPTRQFKRSRPHRLTVRVPFRSFVTTRPAPPHRRRERPPQFCHSIIGTVGIDSSDTELPGLSATLLLSVQAR